MNNFDVVCVSTVKAATFNYCAVISLDVPPTSFPATKLIWFRNNLPNKRYLRIGFDRSSL